MPSLGDWPDMSQQTKAPQQIAAVSTFLPLAIIAVAMRTWIRARMIRNFGWDDAIMIVALINFIVYCAALMVIVANGGGTHLRDMDEMRIGINWTLVAEVFYLTTILFLKISLGLFFLRVVQKKWQCKVVIATMVISTVIQTFHTIFIIFSCGDPRMYLEHMLARKCVSKRVELGLAYEQAAITTLTDFVFAILPIPMLWNATMDRRSKFSVAFVLLLGTSGGICSIVRFKYIDGLGSHEDFFWNAANVSIWSTMEMATGIIAGSLATMRPLFKKLVYKARFITHVGPTRGGCGNGDKTSRARFLGRDKSSSTSMSRSQKEFSEWTKTMNSQTQTFTTTVLGGPELEYADSLTETKGAQLLNFREEKIYPKEIWNQDPERARIWPYSNDSGISKVIDVEVRVSRGEEPWTGNSVSASIGGVGGGGGGGGGMWGKPMDEIIKSPRRARKGSKSSDEESIPEWDKLPDLIPPSRHGSEGSSLHRHSRSRSRTPPLVRISSR